MLFIIFLLFSLMTALAQQTVSIFDYSQVAPCASSCGNIFLAEWYCKPPVTPISSYATYRSCFCESKHLEKLYAGTGLCSQVCTDEEQRGIYEYFNVLRGQKPLSFSSSLPESTTLPPAAASISSSLASEPTQALPPPSPSATSQPKYHGAWLHGHWKYLIIAGVLLVAFMAILLALAVLHRRRRQIPNAKASNEGNGAIPLQILAPPADLSRPHTGGSEFSRPSAENPPSTQPASPLAPDNSPFSMGNRLRAFAAEAEEREAWYAARRAAGYVPSWKLPRGQGTLDDE